MNQKIIDFYSHRGTDHRGRTFDDILSFNDLLLERTHDYIQWLFPSTEPSSFNQQAPVLDIETIAEFQYNQQLRDNVIFAWNRMMNFYISNEWVSENNHNYLRINRILHFLALCNLRSQVAFLLSFALNKHIRNPDLISIETTNYWIAAAATNLESYMM